MSSSPAAAGESTSCCCAAATSADLVRWRRAGRGRNQSRRTDASLANRRAPPPPPDPTARALPRHSRPPLQIFPVRTGLSAGTVGPSLWRSWPLRPEFERDQGTRVGLHVSSMERDQGFESAFLHRRVYALLHLPAEKRRASGGGSLDHEPATSSYAIIWISS